MRLRRLRLRKPLQLQPMLVSEPEEIGKSKSNLFPSLRANMRAGRFRVLKLLPSLVPLLPLVLLEELVGKLKEVTGLLLQALPPLLVSLFPIIYCPFYLELYQSS